MPILLLIVALVLTAHNGAGGALSVVPGESIQVAVAMARPGDTIDVGPGTYYEHLKIDKPVVLRGIGVPVIDATASGSGITLEADSVTLQGFSVINAGKFPGDDSGEAGIRVLSNNNTILGNEASHNSVGILVAGVNNTLSNNTARFNLGEGLRLEGSGNFLSGNLIDGNNRCDVCEMGINIWSGMVPISCC